MSDTNRTKNTNEIITGYKAFDPDFKFQDHQFEVGKTYKREGEFEGYSKDFRFYTNNPLNVFKYYDLVDIVEGLPTRFAKVSTDEKDAIVTHYDAECVTSKISIDEEITLDELINEQIEEAYNPNSTSNERAKLLIAQEYGLAFTDKEPFTNIISNKQSTAVALTQDYSMAAATRSQARLASTGEWAGLFATDWFASLSSSGYGSKIYNSGNHSSIAASGGRSQLRIISLNAKVASCGDKSTLNVKGDCSDVASSGMYSTLRITGDHTGIASSGYRSELTVTGEMARMAVAGNETLVTYEGKGGVISVLGIDAKFKGSEGTLVCAVAYNEMDEPIDIITGRIGENGLKPDTLYTVSDGEFVEVEA